MDRDIRRAFPSVHQAVDKVRIRFPDDPLMQGVGKTIAILQILDNMPVTVQNVASLMHSSVDGASLELSHAFLLPPGLLSRLGEYSEPAIGLDLERARVEIDSIAFALFGFDESDCTLWMNSPDADVAEVAPSDEVDDGEENEIEPLDDNSALLSWCVGVVFGRFDWRLATGERPVPPEPDPFDPLPAKSAGMLPDGAAPFHAHSGILIDDPGHPHDLPRLVEDVFATIDYPAPEEVRHWLRREFFPLHLRQYSKSRRKAPIYWPLSTASGGYTLWLYYPALTDQTLYIAANDFVGPKLEETSRVAAALRYPYRPAAARRSGGWNNSRIWRTN